MCEKMHVPDEESDRAFHDHICEDSRIYRRIVRTCFNCFPTFCQRWQQSKLCNCYFICSYINYEQTKQLQKARYMYIWAWKDPVYTSGSDITHFNTHAGHSDKQFFKVRYPSQKAVSDGMWRPALLVIVHIWPAVAKRLFSWPAVTAECLVKLRSSCIPEQWSVTLISPRFRKKNLHIMF